MEGKVKGQASDSDKLPTTMRFGGGFCGAVVRCTASFLGSRATGNVARAGGSMRRSRMGCGC